MTDIFLFSLMIGGLLLMVLIVLSIRSGRNATKISRGNIVISENKLVPSKFWSGSSNARNYDDEGDLEVDNKGIRFSGEKTSIVIPKATIKDMSSFTRKSPWLILIILDALLIAVFIYSWFNQPPLVILIFMILAVLNGVALVYGTGVEWIRINYIKDGNLKTLYLGEGYIRSPFLGTIGIVGGNLELYKQMKNILH